MVRIYCHSTAGDVIDIDVASGRWLPVPDDPDTPLHIGCASIAQRENMPVRGSYTVENGRRYCLFWTDERELVFLTHDGYSVRLFRREADGALIDLAPRVNVHLQPATHGDGRELPGVSTFSLRDGEGGIIHEVTYDSAAYVRQFGMASMLTFIPDEDLGDWDFFVGARQGLDALRSIASHHPDATQS